MTCQQLGCNSDATHRVYWPGSHPMLTCKSHTEKAQEVGKAMGITIPVEEILHDPNAESKKK